MLSQEQLTEETLAALADIQKAQTSGIMSGTGITNYDLSGLVSQIPVVTPFFDIIPTEKSTDGSKYAVWRALLNTNAAQPDPATPFDYAGSELVFSEQDFQAAYKVLEFDTSVSQDSYDLALGYADPFAIATFNLVNQMLIAKDHKFIGAQSFALTRRPRSTTPAPSWSSTSRTSRPRTRCSNSTPASARIPTTWPWATRTRSPSRPSTWSTRC